MFLHGFTDSADSFIINGEMSQAFIAAREGYDVWLPNFRGNKHSMAHQTLNSTFDLEYWHRAIAFKAAKYDLPAFINFAKEKKRFG